MLFNSLEFIIFFPTVILLYFATPYRFRWLLLLVASYTFYMFWRVDYALLLIASTLIDYACGRMMGRIPGELRQKRKPWLWLSLLSNLGILFTFKYFNFFSEAAGDLAALLDLNYATPVFEILLPMGISFYTFQTMSYSIDVYYGRIQAEKHLGIFALFVTFFPQLVAGPIERAGNLLNQLKTEHKFDYDRAASGARLMAWGFFKKVVIADRLAVFVNEVYNNPGGYEGIPLMLATLFFAFQIYCDFSGYSDIAIGAARIMGFELMVNFRSPYFAISIKDFWNRWHISLSTWFRDYLYLPLGGNRVVKWRWYYNLFIVFLVSGIWHGANWTFIIWGALHGLYLVIGNATKGERGKILDLLRLNRLPKLHKLLQVFTTFSLVCIAWVFFRANTLTDAWYILTHMFTGFSKSVAALTSGVGAHWKLLYLNQVKEMFYLSVLFVTLLVLIEFANTTMPTLRRRFDRLPVPLKVAFYGFTGACIFLFGNFSETQFIYFQF
ncbi:MBOAT family protein [Cesiribacter sp. SM1]|uniref:MBOAT family O-acyltransferase n=1 Tax=Cesiribacter sp. SM1 TaxID=2861196 RepID=UPI001CD4605D|nr:MBOAT family O-acyltransferase [Cesiribacter sp. SM1]